MTRVAQYRSPTAPRLRRVAWSSAATTNTRSRPQSRGDRWPTETSYGSRPSPNARSWSTACLTLTSPPDGAGRHSPASGAPDRQAAHRARAHSEGNSRLPGHPLRWPSPPGSNGSSPSPSRTQTRGPRRNRPCGFPVQHRNMTLTWAFSAWQDSNPRPAAHPKI